MGFVFLIVAQIVLLNFLSILAVENIKAGRKASTVITAIRGRYECNRSLYRHLRSYQCGLSGFASS